MIRDMPHGDDNPYSMLRRQRNIVSALGEAEFEIDKDYIITVVPNIVDITYGRNVGYSITQERLGEEIEAISATDIRNNK